MYELTSAIKFLPQVYFFYFFFIFFDRVPAVCLICMPCMYESTSAIRFLPQVYLICMPCMYALYVCLVCMPCMYACDMYACDMYACVFFIFLFLNPSGTALLHAPGNGVHGVRRHEAGGHGLPTGSKRDLVQCQKRPSKVPKET